MKNIFPFLILLLIAHCSLFFVMHSYSQKVLLSQDVRKDSVIPTWGPNRKNFMAIYVSLGGIIGKSEEGASVLYNHSSEFTAGLIYKKRLTNHEAIGYRISYDLCNYRLKPNSVFPSANSLIHEKEKMDFNSITLALFDRINFDKRRGNFLGHYLDIGAYGSWYFSVRHYSKDDIGGTIVKTYMSHLPYTENLGYGAMLNLGFNRFSIYSKYRISDYFKDSYNLPSLPRFTIGIISLFSN